MAAHVVVHSSFNDVNSDRVIPPSGWIRWALLARMKGFNTTVLADLLGEGGAVVMVKAQAVRVLVSGHSLLDEDIHIMQTPYSVGKTSLTLKYRFEVDGKLVAEAFTVMVRVASNNTAAPMPAWLYSALEWEIPSQSGPPEVLAVASRRLEAVRSSSTGTQAQHPKYSHDVLTRPSDEDSLHHVTHWRYVQFFEDAIFLQKRGVPDYFYIDYVTQLHNQAMCEVRFVEDGPSGLALSLHKKPATPKEEQINPSSLVTRAFATWSNTVTEAPRF